MVGERRALLISSWRSMTEAGSVRLLTYEDLPTLLAWRNHLDVRRFMLTQHEITLEEHQRWFSAASQDSTRRLLIVEDAHGAIGFVQFSSVGPGSVAEWGFYARPDAAKGSGRKIGFAALDYAFQGLRLHKVCGQAIERNVTSIAFHKRLGFQQEGVLREQVRIEGTYHTLLCFGMLATEWI